MEFIYLIQTAKCINTNIYKIGKTTQQNGKRFYSYEPGSIILFYKDVEDSTKAEKDLINHFSINFKHCETYGLEYFEGNKKEMEKIIFNYLLGNLPVVLSPKDKKDTIAQTTTLFNITTYDVYFKLLTPTTLLLIDLKYQTLQKENPEPITIPIKSYNPEIFTINKQYKLKDIIQKFKFIEIEFYDKFKTFHNIIELSTTNYIILLIQSNAILNESLPIIQISETSISINSFIKTFEKINNKLYCKESFINLYIPHIIKIFPNQTYSIYNIQNNIIYSDIINSKYPQEIYLKKSTYNETLNYYKEFLTFFNIKNNIQEINDI